MQIDKFYLKEKGLCKIISRVMQPCLYAELMTDLSVSLIDHFLVDDTLQLPPSLPQT
jgi:hypothetical protein